MKKQLLALTVSLTMIGFAGAAQAEGCVKGAVVGGVAGHMAGHGKMGAAGGCAVGHHSAKKHDKQAAQAAQSSGADKQQAEPAPAK